MDALEFLLYLSLSGRSMTTVYHRLLDNPVLETNSFQARAQRPSAIIYLFSFLFHRKVSTTEKPMLVKHKIRESQGWKGPTRSFSPTILPLLLLPQATKPCLIAPHPDASWTLSGMATPSPPWAGPSSAWPLSERKESAWHADSYSSLLKTHN